MVQSADQNDQDDDIEERLGALRRAYITQLPVKVAEVEAVLLRVRDDPCSTAGRTGLSTIQHLAHKLAGSGATFELPDVHRLAQNVEAIAGSIESDVENGANPSAEALEHAVTDLRAAANDAVMEEAHSDFATGADAEAAPPRKLIYLAASTDRADDLATDLQAYNYDILVVDASVNPTSWPTLDTAVAILADGRFNEGDLDVKGALSEVKRRAPDRTPIVFLSDTGDLKARIAAVRAGGAKFLMGPVNTADVVDALDQLIVSQDVEPYRILIVDDDATTGRYTEIVLSGAGMITSLICDPALLMEELLTFAPELILMDLYMPDCDGRELAAVIRQQDHLAGIPIVFLSAEHDIDLQLGALGQGGDEFLTKPIRPDRLISAVETKVKRFRVLRAQMVRDGLTGLLNHSTTNQFLQNEVDRSSRTGAPLSLAMIDIDHFKKVNDTFGHQVGDQVIRALSRLLRQRLRSVDLVGRMGGEEFAAILIGTDADRAEPVLNEIRETFAAMTHHGGKKRFNVTISCGIADTSQFKDATKLLDAADKALYAAKNGGRNQVTLASK